MIVKFDYLDFSEEVYITNENLDVLLWQSFYNSLCDYLPDCIITFSNNNISFPWRSFLSIKSFISQYLTAHRNEIKIIFTPKAKEMIKSANKTSYNEALLIPHRLPQDINMKLKEVGFIRKLTINQENNLEKISQLPSAATFSVPGAGKTTEALAFFFINAQEQDRLLVVAPKNAFGAWDEQLIACMGNKYNASFVRLRYGEEQIREDIKSKPRFMIITYDQLIRVKDVIIEVLKPGNVFMFLDESHRIKGGKHIKRADTVLQLAHLPKRKLIMSGTPMPQSPRDLISQFSFLYPTKQNNESTVIENIQPIYVRTTKGQLGIPEIHHKVISLQMSDLQRKIYNALKSEMKRQMISNISDGSIADLRKIGKCVMKVMEFVSNPTLLANDLDYAFSGQIGNLLRVTNGPKIEYVCQRARRVASQGKKVIIWSTFVQNVELLALRLNDLGAEFIHGGVDAGDENENDTREGKIKRFHDDPNCKVLVANPAACSEGISLHLYFASPKSPKLQRKFPTPTWGNLASCGRVPDTVA